MRCPKCSGADIIYDNWTRDAARCPICGKWWAMERVVVQELKKADWRKQENIRQYKPCPVIGCNMRINADSNADMCSKCRGDIKSFRKNRTHTKEAPVLWCNDRQQWARRGA